MNIKTLTLLVIMASFLTGAFISVLDPTHVNWVWFTPVLTVGVVALYIFRKAHHGEAKASHRLSGNLQILDTSLKLILGNLEKLNADSGNLPVYEARFEIDRLLREDLLSIKSSTLQHHCHQSRHVGDGGVDRRGRGCVHELPALRLGRNSREPSARSGRQCVGRRAVGERGCTEPTIRP